MLMLKSGANSSCIFTLRHYLILLTQRYYMKHNCYMLKSHLFPSGRIGVYWDGEVLFAHADALRDPSLHWLDLPAMGPPGARHVWIAPAPSPARASKAAIVAYGRALGALGVDLRDAAPRGAATECLRCGHGWDDHGHASDLALALAVLEDGLADRWDGAFVFASPRVLAAVATSLGRQRPEKWLGRVTFAAPSPRGARAGSAGSQSLHVVAALLPGIVEADDGARIAQPLGWRRPVMRRRARPSPSCGPAHVHPA